MNVKLAIATDLEVMHGATVFSGTRVTVKALFDSLSAGGTVDEFLESFPSVSREQVETVLSEAAEIFAQPPH